MSDWGDVFHPDSVKLYGKDLLDRARTALLFHTGIDKWDEACDDTGGGIDDFWYEVILGSSNVGKTQLAISLAVRALHEKFAVIFLTLEEPMDQIQRRVYSATSNLGYYDFTYKNWTQAKRDELAVPYLGKLVVNEDQDRYTLDVVMGLLDDARDALFGRPAIVILDNLQLVHPRAGQSVGDAATDLSEGLRRWARKNRTATFALSQVTAECIRSGRPIVFADAWGGSAVYSNPSQVITLDHTAVSYDPMARWIKRLWMSVAKNRYGPAGVTFPVEANMKTGIWRCALPDEVHLWEPNPWTTAQKYTR